MGLVVSQHLRLSIVAVLIVFVELRESSAEAQVFVYPRRPGQSRVRYFDFEWKHLDIKVDPHTDGGISLPYGAEPGLPTSDGGTYVHGLTLADGGTPPGWKPPSEGSVRLYFYERERHVAEYAVAHVSDSYTYLANAFHYIPEERFPYILYNSYQEFLQTNLFPLQEGILGVTSPQTLTLTLPYFGDHRLFARVSTHEMTHQFTIQKLHSLAKVRSLNVDPLDLLPLWFVEGIAEFYALRGLDDESEMLVRDIVINPDVEHGFALPDFFADTQQSFLGVYKLGEARCTFLEETYGPGTLQSILDETAAYAGNLGERFLSFAGVGVPGAAFKSILKRVTHDDHETISKKFEAWMKRRAFRHYVQSAQDIGSLRLLPETSHLVEAMSGSPDGNVLLIRALNTDSGETSLLLLDPRFPEDTKRVAIDDVPGVESLHPTTGRNFDLTNKELVFIAERQGRDILYWQSFEHKVELYRGHPRNQPVEEEPSRAFSAKFSLGSRRAFDVGKEGILAAYSPSFSPDGKRVAFVGANVKGIRDVYVLEPRDGNNFRLIQLTHDDYAERQVSWGPQGIVFSSDATPSGRYNLFRVRLENPDVIEQLTFEDRDEQDPRVLPDGRVLFTAYDQSRADIHEIVDGEIVRRTELVTGAFDAAPAPSSGLWVLFHHSGRKRIAEIKKTELTPIANVPQITPGAPIQLEKRSLAGGQRYQLLDLHNWQPPLVFGFVGGGSFGLFGQILAATTDKLGDHGVLLNLFFYGGFDLLDGYLLYINQERRISWGVGPFHSLRFRYDTSFPDVAFTSAERFYGGEISMRYPISRFIFLQGDLGVGAANYFVLSDTKLFLTQPELNHIANLYPTWRRANAGTRFQTELAGILGYDTIINHPRVGPLTGNSILLEAIGTTQPANGVVFGNIDLDAEQFVPIITPTRMVFRLGSGTTFGGRLARQFYLSSFDTVRGVPFGDPFWLLGRHYLFSTAELRVPLSGLIHIFLFSSIEGIAGIDFGSVSNQYHTLFERRVLDAVLGFNLALGPLLFRLHFAKPIGIAAPAGLPSSNGAWVTNFSIRLIGLGGYLSMGRSESRTQLGAGRF